MVQLSPDQLQAVRELEPGKILIGGVGSGKSRTALAYFLGRVCGAEFPINGAGDFGSVPNAKDLYIITTAKKRNSGEWLTEAIDFLLTTSRENSYGCIQVTVDSWNNIQKYENVDDAFFIFDEQRLVGSGAWVKSFLKIAKKNEWVILSATPGDVWMDYVPVFLANGLYSSRTAFCDKHVMWNPYSKFPQVRRYLSTATLERHRRSLTVNIEYERHTTRHVVNLFVDYDQALWDRVAKDRWHVYEDRPVKEAGELVHVMRRVVNSEKSRLEELAKTLDKHPKLILFYNYNYELDILREYCAAVGKTYAEWNGQKHQEIPRTDDWLYIVQYTAGAEGWNCIETDAELFYSLNYSYKIMEQSMGRIDRRNTPYTDLYYYLLRSTAPIDQAIMKAIQMKKKFNEKLFTQKVLI